MQAQQALVAYLQSTLESEHQLKLDAQLLNQMQLLVDLEERPLNEAEEFRSIKVKRNSDGQAAAESFKLYNITKISLHEWLMLLGEGAGVALFDETKKRSSTAWSC